MLRISVINPTDGDAGEATLKLEGALLVAWHDEVRAACDAARASHPRVRLDLSNLAFADVEGANLLRSLIARPGVALGECSSFVTELLHLESRHEHANFDDRR